MVMCAVGYILLATSAVVGVVYSHDVHSYLSCTHNISQPVHIVHWYWKIGPLLLYSIGKTIVCVLELEFVIAQSPDNMKGFVLGLTLASNGVVYLVLVEANELKVTLCYDLQALVVLVVMFVVFVVLSKCYTLRERNREINIQAIVEEHYERYMDQEEEYSKLTDSLIMIKINNKLCVPSVFIMLVTFGVSDGCVQMFKLLCVEDSVHVASTLYFYMCNNFMYFQVFGNVTYRHNVCTKPC